MTREGMSRLEELGMQYIRGNLPSWYYVCALTVQTVAIYKTGEKTSVRPLGLRNPLLKTWHRMVSRGNRQAIKDFVEPQQVVLSQGGAGLLVSSVRESLEVKKGEDWVCFKVDIMNAFNEMLRAETVKVFSEEPSLQHMAAFTGITLAPYIGLEIGASCGEGQVKGELKGTQRQETSSA